MEVHILLIGVNHTTAPLGLRERLAIGNNDLAAALDHFAQSNGQGPRSLIEGVILSTCNRLELYAAADDPHQGLEELIQFLSQKRRVPVEAFSETLYVKSNEDAVAHLFRVACGLDSMVVGEPQILGQVNDAYRAALDRNATGMILNTLFRHAIQVGRRARTETAIGQCATSVPAAAAALAEQEMDCLNDCRVLVVGASEMGRIAARTLMARGASDLVVANRSYDRAVKLAHEFNGEATTLYRLAEVLLQADIIITATASPHVILTSESVRTAMERRPERPMLIIDIAVPRDVEPAIANIPGVRLFDVDDLQDVVNANLAARQGEIPSVEGIADQETAAFMAWFNALNVVPTVIDIRQRAEAIKAQELELALRRLGDVGDRERQVVCTLAHRLVNKLMHEPTVRLKQQAAQGDCDLYTDVVRELFGLEGGTSGKGAT